MSKLPLSKDNIVKFIMTSIMMMMTIYIYSIMRNSKDILVINEIGAELISALKLWGVLPCAILFVALYTKLLSYYNRLTLYYAFIFAFGAFFVLFASYLYPCREALAIDTSSLMESLPQIKYVLLMFAHWPISLFYIMSELWGSLMLALMFFQFCNQIYSVDDAKGIYPLFGFFAQGGLILSALVMKYINIVYADPTSWQVPLNYIVLSILISMVILCLAIWYVTNFEVDKDIVNGVKKSSKTKVKMGVMDSFKYIMSSRYIRLVALLIISYGISINLVEGVWKKTAGMLFTNHNDLSRLMSDLQLYTGISACIAMLFSAFALKCVSWRTGAILTPIVIGITGTFFFIFAVYGDHLESAAMEWFAKSTLWVAVMIGMVQNILSKATKYAFFDPTKEMTYIPLDEELKAKGKAAADVIGGRLGKSGGAFTQWAMLAFISGSSLVSLAPNLFVIFLIMIAIWIYAVLALSVEFEKKNN